ncbi:hypothetical protein A3J78_00895 [Candidatus Beckwithbacteria bacterium RBG_13_35_6]|uniref:Type 4a pilus biogenesis protein PilO n=1 Tax=Candidatus Beckwithbacteria bacterium RBG_13_35_6 TaxID=1797456 RepID=A0A1F5DE03_9BACT|nr:MAG: hypothetical protein A3J78_00895 [Candidatus Beckwithbacteria bacterium RBG_13_35_6]
MKKKLNFIIIALIISCQLLVIFTFSQMITKNTDSLVEQKNKLWALQDKEKSLYKLQADYDLLKEDLQLLAVILPDKRGIIDFLSELEKEASASGLTIKINFNEKSVKKEADNLFSVSFSLNLNGTYFGIVNFIKKVERVPQFVIIEDVNIQSPEGLDKKNNAILKMKCYVDPMF